LKAGRNNFLTTTDPVTTEKAIAQFELLEQLLDFGHIDYENFYKKSGDTHSLSTRAQKITDIANSSRLFEGQWIDEHASHEGGYLDVEFVNMLTLLDEPEYSVRSAEFTLSATKDSYAKESTKKEVSDWEEFSGNIKDNFKAMYTGKGNNRSVGGVTITSGNAAVANYAAAATPVTSGGSAVVGVGASVYDTFRGKQQAKEDAKFAKEMKGGHILDSKIIIVDIPNGYVFSDFSVYDAITSSKADKFEVIPQVNVFAIDENIVQFQTDLFVTSAFISDEYFLFDGKIEVLFERKL